MSNKLTVKPSKKDRPKSSDKLRKGRREGTPEKTLTPTVSQGAVTDETNQLTRFNNVIINDEIRALAIPTDQLTALPKDSIQNEGKASHQSILKTQNVVVRKKKPEAELERQAVKSVIVAKPAPANAKIKDPGDYGGTSVKFDSNGKIIAHSILGPVHEFLQQARQFGDFPEQVLSASQGVRNDGKLSVKYERRTRPTSVTCNEDGPSNALLNWQLRMKERRKQQGYLSKLLDKPANQLVMNQADDYRKTQELRHVIDRSIPAVDYGKGYRIGSEFWKQQEEIRVDETGLHMTLTQTEKGQPLPIEHVSVPDQVHQEKGSNWVSQQSQFHKPWHKTPYLAERRRQLQPIINELDPHLPDASGLEVIGQGRPKRPQTALGERLLAEMRPKSAASRPGSRHVSSIVKEDDSLLDSDPDQIKRGFSEMEILDPLPDHPDVRDDPVIGPSVLFSGQQAAWSGDDYTYKGQVALEARVLLETVAGKRVTSFLHITNNGTTAIYYDWKRLPQNNPFDLVNQKIQRFYFKTAKGVIAPGDELNFPFVFKSPNAGVFSEQWQWTTAPVLCGGASLIVTLRGVALQEDKFQKQRATVEKELTENQTAQIVESVLTEILEGVRTPPRTQTPIDAFLTEEQAFLRKQTLDYIHSTVRDVDRLHSSLLDTSPLEPIDPSAEHTEAAADEPWDLATDTVKQMVLALPEADDRKEDYLSRMNQPISTISLPSFSAKQRLLYQLGYDALSEAVEEISCEAAALVSALGITDTEPDELNEETIGDAKKSTASKAKIESKKSLKDERKTPKGGSKDSVAKSGKGTPATGAGTGSRSQSRPVQQSRERLTTPATSPIPTASPLVTAKLSDKLYTLTKKILSNASEDMSESFIKALDS